MREAGVEGFGGERLIEVKEARRASEENIVPKTA